MTDQERLHQQDMEIIKNLCIFDDDFLRLVFDGDTESTALVLNIVLDRDDLTVTSVVGQREIKGIEGHSVKLDIMAVDGEGNAFDIEVQRQDKGNLPLRARYNSSMMDTVLLPEGEDYSKLVPTYVIFFTEKDVIGDNEPLHHYMMQDIKTGHILGDEKHIIFVNGENKDVTTRLGKLIHDFHCKSADEMYYKPLAKRMRHFKESEGGITQVSKLIEDMLTEYGKEVAERVSKETAIETTIRTCRKHRVSESEIFAEIMEEYGLTESQAKSYLDSSRESA